MLPKRPTAPQHHFCNSSRWVLICIYGMEQILLISPKWKAKFQSSEINISWALIMSKHCCIFFSLHTNTNIDTTSTRIDIYTIIQIPRLLQILISELIYSIPTGKHIYWGCNWCQYFFRTDSLWRACWSAITLTLLPILMYSMETALFSLEEEYGT